MSALSRPAMAERDAGSFEASGTGTDEAPVVAFGPLAESLGFRLRLAQIKAFEDFFTAFAEEGLQPGSFSVLITIGENPGIRQGVLAGALMIKRSHMAKIVQGFDEAGLVERRVPQDDRRAVELTLTTAGRRRVEAVMPKFLEHEHASAAALTETERQTLLSLLMKLGGF